MNIAIIKENEVINAAVFDDIETARQFHEMGVWAESAADGVAELPDGFGIGDSYLGGEWVKKPQPEIDEPQEPETVPEPSLEEKVAQLEKEISELKKSNAEFQTDFYMRLVSKDIIDIEKIPDNLKENVTLEINKTVDVKKNEGG